MFEEVLMTRLITNKKKNHVLIEELLIQKTTRMNIKHRLNKISQTQKCIHHMVPLILNS